MTKNGMHLPIRVSRRALFIGAAAAAALPIGARVAAAQSKTLRLRVPNALLSLDPAFQTSEDETGANIYEGLVTYKPGTWEIVNQLAETFEAAPDGKAYRFTLKQGM